MSFLGFLKGATGVVHAALPVVQSFEPFIGALGPFGAIADAAINVIVAVDRNRAAMTAQAANLTPGPNADDQMAKTNAVKKADVMTHLDLMSPLISALINKPINDPARLVKGVDQIVEGLIDVLKAVGDLPSTPPTPSSGNTATPTAAAHPTVKLTTE